MIRLNYMSKHSGGFEDYSVSNTVEFIPTKVDGYSDPVWKTLPPMNIKRYAKLQHKMFM